MEMSELVTSFIFDDNLDFAAIATNLQKGDNLIIIKDFPLSDFDLQSFIDCIGEPIKENRNNNRESVFDVKIVKQNNLFTSISSSNLAFPLHTDCADFDSIPNCIGLLCVEPAKENQGVNCFMPLNKLLLKLPEGEIQKLINKKWKFRNQFRSILTAWNNSYKICYDRIIMESFAEMNETDIEELTQLDNLFESVTFKIKLKKGELVLFRNDLMLHGRSEIDINSNRLIKRIRFNIHL